MGVRSTLVLLLLACLISLTPFAQAGPPDPTWIAGIYDDDDYDDIVCLLTSSSGAIETGPLGNAQPPLLVAGWVSALESDRAPRSPSFISQSRGPPAS